MLQFLQLLSGDQDKENDHCLTHMRGMQQEWAFGRGGAWGRKTGLKEGLGLGKGLCRYKES